MTSFTRRTGLRYAALSLSLMAAVPIQAQTFPAKPIRVVLPFSAGSGPDAVLRHISEKVTKSWGHQFTVDNKPGANGWLSAGDVKRTAPDGYNVLMVDVGTTGMGAGMPGGKAAPADKPKFDFYKILPGSEEPVTEKDLKAAAKAKPEESKDIYFLQAGSFQNPADADNRKAQLAILGFEAAVEPVNLPDKGTWYRVRLGPYTKIDEINKMRSTDRKSVV